MALLVWLPLNGNLNNQGLSDVAVSNSGATVSDNGKIGKCYYFDGNNHFLQFNKSLTNLYTGDCSWALWVKPIDDTRGSLITEYASTGASNVALELYTNRRLRIYWNGSPDYFPQYSLTKDAWTHVAVTRHNNELRVYINGALIETKSDTTLAPRTSTSQIRIGDDYRGGSSVSYQGYLNDIRIYDHCLSPKEVKEISQGLVLHYKLTPTNLIKNGWGGTDNWSSKSSNYISTDVPTTPTGVKNSYSNNLSQDYIPLFQDHSYTMSEYEKKGTSTYQYLYLSLVPYDVDKLQIYIQYTPANFKAASLTTISQDLHSGDTVIHLTDASGWANPTTYQYLVAIFNYKDSTGYQYPALEYTRNVYAFGTTSDKSNLDVAGNKVTLLSAYTGQTVPAGTSICLTAVGSTFYYPNVINATNIDANTWTYLSKTFTPSEVPFLKTAKYVRVYSTLYVGQWAAAITLIDNTAESTVIDCSGFGNNGTRYGNIQFLKDRPRYLSASNYSDSACAIGIGNLSSMVPEGLFTFNIWFKKITGEWSARAWETLLGGPSGFELESKLSTTQNAYIHPYSWGGGSTTTPNAYSIAYDLDKWNMVTMVRDTSNTKFYLNGELKVTGARASMPSGDYFIGAWKTALQQNYRGYLSDARIYATALSAEDIQDLYTTSASIYNNASAEAFEFVEESSGDTQVTKTGIFEGKDFREISKNLFNKEEVAFNSGNYGSYGPNAFEMKPLNGKVCPKRSIPIKPDTYYVLSYDETQVTINLNAFNTVFWDITGTRSLAQLTSNANGLVNKIKFKSPANAYFVSFSNYGTLTDAQQQTLVNTLQFEEGETWTEYQEHDITNAAIYEDKVEAKQIIET